MSCVYERVFVRRRIAKQIISNSNHDNGKIHDIWLFYISCKMSVFPIKPSFLFQSSALSTHRNETLAKPIACYRALYSRRRRVRSFHMLWRSWLHPDGKKCTTFRMHRRGKLQKVRWRRVLACPKCWRKQTAEVGGKYADLEKEKKSSEARS